MRTAVKTEAPNRASSPDDPKSQRVDKVITKQRLWGDVSRWRRFGEPTPAGHSRNADGTPDYGMYGPGTLTWRMLLHPATSIYQFAFQQKLQLSNKAINAGIRDTDTMNRKARAGTMTIFDAFERGQRNSGIHAPLWLGDTPTATKVAKHLTNIHRWVAGDVIDAGEPELGNYAANAPRESMWATLTEMTSLLWLYESFAFRDGQDPHPLTDAERDRFVAEQAKYIRIFPHVEQDIPSSYAELVALYERDAHLFGYTATLDIYPPTGEPMRPIQERSMLKNLHPSQLRVLKPLNTFMMKFDDSVNASFPDWAREYLRLSPDKEKKGFEAKQRQLPLIKKMQQDPATVRYYRRMMWGPDAITLMESAEQLQKEFDRDHR